ncbi:MAG: hypothetical protein JWR83_421 [Aeromicrobium sp.]|nr:hypothetical protein [Aeromicrobium sp.]
MSNVRGIILDLRRVVYQCELAQHPELSDGARQSLWDSVVSTLADIRQLDGCEQATPGQIVHERQRQAAPPGRSVVIPDGVSLDDVETGCLAAPCVDPAAARNLAERLIERLEEKLDQV